MRFVYAVLLRNRKFLMVYNTRRGGWEMPGGSVRRGETPLEAVKREVKEETGLSFSPVDSRELGEGSVFVGRLPKDLSMQGEMRWGLFISLPDHLAFSREEYEGSLDWARKALRGGNEGLEQ